VKPKRFFPLVCPSKVPIVLSYFSNAKFVFILLDEPFTEFDLEMARE
jgi:hypothetical protein